MGLNREEEKKNLMKNEHAWMKEGFSFLQWVVFLLANALSLPVVIGQLYHLSLQKLPA